MKPPHHPPAVSAWTPSSYVWLSCFPCWRLGGAFDLDRPVEKWRRSHHPPPTNIANFPSWTPSHWWQCPAPDDQSASSKGLPFEISPQWYRRQRRLLLFTLSAIQKSAEVSSFPAPSSIELGGSKSEYFESRSFPNLLGIAETSFYRFLT